VGFASGIVGVELFPQAVIVKIITAKKRDKIIKDGFCILTVPGSFTLAQISVLPIFGAAKDVAGLIWQE
jgi:hypothetical protein